MRPRNVHFTLTKMAIANQTQLTPLCFGYDRAALSAPSLVGELEVTLRDLPHTLFGSLRAPRFMTLFWLSADNPAVTVSLWQHTHYSPLDPRPVH